MSWLTVYLSLCSLEVILKDASNPLEPIEVAREVLPYSFDVRSAPPRTKGPTSSHTQQANIGSATPSTPFSAQRVAGPHPEGIEREIRREPVAGGPPDHGHVSAMSEPGPSVLHAYRPSGRGSGLPMRLEDSSFAPSAYNTSDNLGEQDRLLFPQGPNSSFGTSHIDTNTEVHLLSKVADRAVEIGTLEKSVKHLRDVFEADGRKQDAILQPLIQFYHQTLAIQNEIAGRLNGFMAERRKAETAVNAQVADLEGKISTLKEENERDVALFTSMTNTSPWMGSGGWSGAGDQVLPQFGWAPDSES